MVYKDINNGTHRKVGKQGKKKIAPQAVGQFPLKEMIV
jgi:hypothetical protein